MKKFIAVCIAAWFLWGCSPSHPSIVDATVSDNNPVTGQKVLFQVLSVSDNFPLHYTWQAEGGVLEAGEATDNFAYWKTPDTLGTYKVYCTVTDEKDQNETHVFSIQVSARELETVYDEGTVLSIEKQGESRLGGIWISTENGEVWYITSTSNQSTSWAGAFSTMFIGYSDFSYTLWGGSSADNKITIQSSGNSNTIGCTDCVSIHDILYDSDALFVGSDSGMHRYLPSSSTWNIIKSEKTNAIVRGKYLIYFATSQGIYSFDPLLSIDLSMSPDPTGESWAVLEVVGDDKTTQDIESDQTITLWHVTEDKVCKNGNELGSQPPAGEVAHTLDVDIDGYIWCGKYRWDGSSWWTPPLLEGQEINKVVASTEGRIYFLTLSGALLRW